MSGKCGVHNGRIVQHIALQAVPLAAKRVMQHYSRPPSTFVVVRVDHRADEPTSRRRWHWAELGCVLIWQLLRRVPCAR